MPDAIARRRLTQALWQIRTALSPQPVLLAEGDTVQINPEMPIWSDAAEFEPPVLRVYLPLVFRNAQP